MWRSRIYATASISLAEHYPQLISYVYISGNLNEFQTGWLHVLHRLLPRIMLQCFTIIYIWWILLWRTLFLRVLKRLGFVPPCVRRASYVRGNLSEDYYSPSRVLQDWKQERYFHVYGLDYHSEGIWISTRTYSHLTTSKTLIFNIWFISTVYNR
jgi:hypothetical protein